MKKYIIGILIISVCQVQSFAQTTPWVQQGNNGINPNTDLLGTNDNTPVPIKTNSNLRMLVTAGTGGQSGQIGIGNNLATNFVPQQRFHLHQGNDNNDNYIRWSNGDIGNMTGFDVGLRGEFTLDTNAAIINNRLNTPLRVFQNDIERMTFRQLDSWNGINGESANDVTRITIGHNGEQWPAWSMLHLWDNEGNPGPFSGGLLRPWMDVGLSMTGNLDYLYLGLLERPLSDNTSRTDMVAAWGCQDMESNADNFRFVFIDNLDDTPSNDDASETMQGREIMRLTPMGNVGIGDFSSMVWVGGQGLNEQPTAKLDVDGSARLRQMSPLPIPYDSTDVVITGMEVDALGDYFLMYTPIDSLLSGVDDCDWAVSPDSHVVTGVSSPLPQNWLDACAQSHNVGIGNLVPDKAKLSVYLGVSGTNISTTDVAIEGRTEKELVDNYGVDGRAVGSGGATYNNYGGYFIAQNSPKFNFGVKGIARSTSGFPAATGANYGVYGCATGADDPDDNWAGYFDGQVYGAIFTTTPSDEILKEGVVPLEGATELISQLQPKKYNYRNDEFAMALPQGESSGFLAHELEEILPNLVNEVVHPAMYSEVGELIQEEMTFKGIQYTGLVPILVAGLKEQQMQLASIEERLAILESQIGIGVVEVIDGGNEKSVDYGSTLRYELYQNRPNPFDETTEIVWRMSEDAQAQIIVHDAQGKMVAILMEGMSSRGLHSLEWNASDLMPGTYYYSLEVKGELMVKRAVKIAR